MQTERVWCREPCADGEGCGTQRVGESPEEDRSPRGTEQEQGGFSGVGLPESVT